MDRANFLALSRSISDYFSISESDATARLTEATAHLVPSEGRPSIYAATLDMGIPDHFIAERQVQFVEPKQLLDEDCELAHALKRLSKVSKIALLTNTRTAIARKALLAMGIPVEIFKVIRGGDDMEHPKPSAKELVRIADELNLSPSDCISVGDRWSVDLQPARDAGMATKEVSGRDELVQWLSSIQPA